MKTKTSAPGKLMLFGEHSVVYGTPCIVTAVGKRLYVEVEKIDCYDDELITPQIKECTFVKETLKVFKEKYKIGECVKVTTKGDFSHQVGLGSSSAVTVALVKALSEIFKINLTNKEIFEISYQITLNIQKVGSGFDIAAAVFGKTLFFKTGGKIIEEIEVGKLPLVIGYSGVKADTPKLVKSLKSKVKSNEEKYKKIFEEIGKIVNEAREELINKNWKIVGELMSQNHKLLQQLEVSTSKLDRMCEAAAKAGAWGAKLSGAGGGDCMIAIVEDQKRKAVEAAIQKVGGEIIDVENSTEGVNLI